MAIKVSTFKNRFNVLFDESEKTTISLGKELHVSSQTISAWRLGTRSPKEPTIIAIADYFGVNVEWLMGFNVEKEKHQNIHHIDSELKRITDLFMSLSEANKVSAMNYMLYLKSQEKGIG